MSFHQNSQLSYRGYDDSAQNTLLLLGFCWASLNNSQYCFEEWRYQLTRIQDLFHTQFWLCRNNEKHIHTLTYDTDRLPYLCKHEILELLQQMSILWEVLHKYTCTFCFMIEGKSNFISPSWLEDLGNMKIEVKLCQRWLWLSVCFCFRVVRKCFFIHSFSKMNVWCFKIELSFGTDEELIFEIWRIEHFVQDDWKLSVDS